MIPKRQLKRFINRVRKDYRGWKRLTPAQVEERQEALPIRPPLWRKLSHDQKVCCLIGVKQPRFAFFSDPGIGKTITAISIGLYHRQQSGVGRILVLVPNLSNKAEWAREVRKHTPHLHANVLEGSSDQKWEQLRASKNFITVETYAGFARMVCTLVKKKGKKKLRLKPDRKRIAELAKTFQGFVFDESTGAKSRNSVAWRVCRAVTKAAKMVLLLSGTPFGRNPEDLWAQMFLVDRGWTLGETLGLFRAVFYSSTIDYWGREKRTFIAKTKPLLHRWIASRSVHYAVPEAELPQVNPRMVPIVLSDEQLDWYVRAREELFEAKGDKQKIQLTFLRMRQLSSGFIGLPKDEEGKRAKIVFTAQPKLKALGDLMDELPRGAKAVIIHEFIWSGERIERELRERGHKFVTLRGGVKDPSAVLRAFDKPDCQAIVLNHQAGGFGLNLQTASYLIYYESPVSAIIRRQTERRIVRRFSKHSRVFIYDLIGLGTADEQILEYHAEGKDLLTAILDGGARTALAA